LLLVTNNIHAGTRLHDSPLPSTAMIRKPSVFMIAPIRNRKQEVG